MKIILSCFLFIFSASVQSTISLQVDVIFHLLVSLKMSKIGYFLAISINSVNSRNVDFFYIESTQLYEKPGTIPEVNRQSFSYADTTHIVAWVVFLIVFKS